MRWRNGGEVMTWPVEPVQSKKTYTLFEEHAISGDSLQVDGATYTNADHIYRFYTEDISECMTLCTADADCMGFVDNHQAEPFSTTRRTHAPQHQDQPTPQSLTPSHCRHLRDHH